jgi:hypothetical protein
MRVRAGWCCAAVLLIAADAASAVESVSAEESAFRYQHLAGAIERTGSLIDLFAPEDPYCEHPMRPAKQDDLALLDGWNQRLGQLDRDAVTLETEMGDPDGGLRDASTFEELTGVPPEPHVFETLRRRARELQAKIPPLKEQVKAAREVKCVRSHEPAPPPEPPKPPPPPADPTAGLAPPELLLFVPPQIPEPLCTEEQRQAALHALGEQRYNADENAVRVSHFRHDISLAIVDGRGDPAALRALHDQADQDLKYWDAKSAEVAELWSQPRSRPLDDCSRESGAAPVAPASPTYNFGLSGSYLYQRMPGHSGEAGVIDAGGDEQALLRNPRELDGWTIGAWNTVWNVGPKIAGSAATAYLGGSYGQADGERSNSVGSDPAVANGITWWREQGGSSGVAAAGSNATGKVELDYTTFEIRGGMKWDFPCGDEYDDEDGPPFPPRIRFTLPTTIVETGIGIHYNEQDVRQQFFMGNPNPGFALFDVRTRNKIEATDWSILGNFGVQQVFPIPGLSGALVTAGADVGLGYYHTRADADQQNNCDIRFAATPGVNSCIPTTESFGVSVNPDHSGFDYRVGAGARLSYALDFIYPGVHAGASYQFDYIGISRFESPVNLSRDGTPELDWTHQPRHQVGLFVGAFY